MDVRDKRHIIVNTIINLYPTHLKSDNFSPRFEPTQFSRIFNPQKQAERAESADHRRMGDRPPPGSVTV